MTPRCPAASTLTFNVGYCQFYPHLFTDVKVPWSPSDLEQRKTRLDLASAIGISTHSESLMR
ncbi:hypothetical protein AM1_C0103 (plasmid) [Acaryochloris marina MBIC11017]|uniref:Uncharacterized protein n=1 Tax=Acaryochloris marina (strain MBIC 11017) TaxID=329726 RepID=A8ZMK0_ACAM1|nr:hypothetical protein AM1_C0103 [Acaryochloris marina MBIC11017]